MKKLMVCFICLMIVAPVSFGAEIKKEVETSAIKVEEVKTAPMLTPVAETRIEIPSFLKKLTMNGSLRVRYSAYEAATQMDAFSLSRARIKLTGEITQDILFLVQPDFAALSTGGNVALADAYAQFKLPYTTLKAGQFLLPFAYDSGKYKTIFGTGLNPTYYGVIVPSRDYGLRAAGEITFWKGFYYDGAIVNGTGGAEVNKSKDIVGRLNYKKEGLDIGISGYLGKAGAAQIDKKDIGMDIEYNFSNYQLVAEYLTGQNIAATVKLQDLYCQLSGLFDKHEPLIKYEVYDPDTTVNGNRVNTLTLGYTCYFDKTTRAIVNLNLINEETTQINNNTLFFELQTQI